MRTAAVEVGGGMSRVGVLCVSGGCLARGVSRGCLPLGGGGGVSGQVGGVSRGVSAWGCLARGVYTSPPCGRNDRRL